MPTYLTHRATSSASRLMLHAQRFQHVGAAAAAAHGAVAVLGDRHAAAAATMAAAVEMLKRARAVAARAAGVNTASRGPRSVAQFYRNGAAAHNRASPAISSIVSPFMRRATRNALIWAGVADPAHDLFHQLARLGIVCKQLAHDQVCLLLLVYHESGSGILNFEC